MIRSFLNVLLPEDEYKRLKVLYFIAEAAILFILFCIVLMGADLYFFHWNLYALWFAPYPLVLYIAIRYWSSGIEYPEVGSQQQYEKRKRQIWKFGALTALLTFVLNFAMARAWNDWGIALERLGYSIFFFIILVDVNMFSLKRSYEKNRESLDEEEEED